MVQKYGRGNISVDPQSNRRIPGLRVIIRCSWLVATMDHSSMIFFLTPDMTNFKGVMHYLHRPSLINLFFAGGWVHKIEEESSLAE